MVIHFEPRLDREAIHGRDVRQKSEVEKRFSRQIPCNADQVTPRDYNRSFSAKFNYFRDGFGIPLPHSLHYWILVSFLRFHYKFVRGAACSAIPVKRTFLP